MISDEVETFAKSLLIDYNETNCVNFLRLLRNQSLNHLGIYLGKKFTQFYPFSVFIRDEYAINSFFTNQPELAYDILHDTLQNNTLNEDISNRLLFNQHFSIRYIQNRYTDYNLDKVRYLMNKQPNSLPLVTLSITSCKRFDLFKKTINSILNCFDIDKIDEWFCVDDNSSEYDRRQMKMLYPFFTFYFKTPEEKGHPRSMNIILKHVKTPYLFHTEDDWKFFVKNNYIERMLDIANMDINIGQCLINKNYSETERDIGIKGGIFRTTLNGRRYYIHEFANTENEKLAWLQKHGNGLSSNYWPHFSFRPSLIKTSVLKRVGIFDEKANHFEMEYAYRYVSQGFISVFFEGIYSIHTGRLTSERTDETKLNAYALNNEKQFEGKTELNNVEIINKEDNILINFKYKTYVVNLKHRVDRWQKFQENIPKDCVLEFEKFDAIHGIKLQSTAQLQQIFEHNDYHMRPGLVGCLLSHVQLFVNLINSKYDAFIIFEDDIEFTPNFNMKFLNIIKQIQNTDCDCLFLGHHIKNLETQQHELDRETMPTVTKRSLYWSFTHSLGGTGGFIITKNGAQKFLDFLNRSGATNGIDTLLQKSAGELNVYYCSPHLFYTECFRDMNTPIDSDIQYNHDSNLVRTIEQRFQDEVDFYQKNSINIVELKENDEIIKCAENSEIDFVFYFHVIDEGIMERIKNPYYMLEDKIVFVIPEKMKDNIRRYYHRFKINGKYDISDALQYEEAEIDVKN